MSPDANIDPHTDPAPPEPASSDADLLTLGSALGEASAFGHVSGRCSAARAAAIFRIHEEKLYRHAHATWDAFCPAYLKMSRAEADRILASWREFGPAYFEVAHLTRISTEAFRALAPVIKDGAIHADGESVALTAANASRVANIVAEFRRSLARRKVAPSLEPHIRIAHLDNRCSKLILEFDDLARRERHTENWLNLTRTIDRLRAQLNRLAKENHLQ